MNTDAVRWNGAELWAARWSAHSIIINAFGGLYARSGVRRRSIRVHLD